MPQHRAVSDAGDRVSDVVVGVRTALAAHRPVGERETRAVRTLTRALSRADPPLDERAGPEHLTASGVVVGPRGTVLHLHKRLHRWLQPGGHLEPGEAPCDAARREATEETGLPVCQPPGGPRLLHVDVHPAAGGHVHLDLRYLLVAPDVDPDPPAGESQQARWFSWDEAAAVADEALVGALQAARALLEAGYGPAAPAPAPPAPVQHSTLPHRGRVRGAPSSRHNGGDEPPADRLRAPGPNGTGANGTGTGAGANGAGTEGTATKGRGMSGVPSTGSRPEGARRGGPSSGGTR